MATDPGFHYLAIPGPSLTPEPVLRAMHRRATDIYEGELVEMVPALIEDLKAVARTRHEAAIYIANGHGAWEAALANTLPRGAKVLVAATGLFALGWAEVARGIGARPEIIDFGRSGPLDPAAITERLRRDSGGEIAAVMAVHVDTSTSVRNDIAALRAAIDAAGHGALLMVDCIASLACERFEMDGWGVDLMVAGSQKGLMVPPGLGFVFFGPRAAEARRKASPSRYWDWAPRTAPESFYQYFGGTAPVQHLFGLRAALSMIGAEGLERVWARHALLARAYWAAAEAWGRGGPMRLNIADPAFRSHAVTTLRLAPPQARDLRRWVKARAGLTLGIGLGMGDPEDPQANGVFRIGHMGAVNAQMVMGVIGAMDAGLKALAIPHGPGAPEAAAQVLAEGLGGLPEADGPP